MAAAAQTRRIRCERGRLMPLEVFSSAISTLSSASGTEAKSTLPGLGAKAVSAGAGCRGGRLSTRRVRFTAASTARARRCSTRSSASEKRFAWPEKTSRIPIDFSPTRSGTASIDRMPSARQLSRSTRESVSVSSQRSEAPVFTHSPEKPEPICRRAPTGGASGPELARQTRNPGSSSASAMAAPEARTMLCARSATN